ncbi:hypothetical protein [Hymenobacter cellulosivorans]|uniref:Lipoprotein n=1 Tax=Hymenobacter cellulosivorans TaxID=2932249 RepID=A0ABY4FD57_9BACT|nr:hypothetical protein [Hymenobacter cellulosivorans]UOQ54607.1 hypothetical protein MUN80_07540 [Hymenobacter cellulosivorans]
MKRTLLSVACLTVAGSIALVGCKAKTAEASETTATTETPAAPASTGTPEAAPAPETTTEATATFDLNSVPVSSANLGAWPYLSRLKGYETRYDSDSSGFDFDRTYVFDGKNIIPIEGKIVRRSYRPIDSEKPASELMIQRNYENLVKELGGVKVSSAKIPDETLKKMGESEYEKHSGGMHNYQPVDTYVIRQKDKEVWVQVQTSGDHQYKLNVTERAAMPQQAGVVGAVELKKN